MTPEAGDQGMSGHACLHGAADSPPQHYFHISAIPLRLHRQSGIVARRASAQSDHAALADVLEAWSPGRASHAWDELPALSRRMPILLITGEEDEKFVGLQQAMLQRCQPAGTSGIGVQAATILSAGHAVHLERPLELAGAIEAWLKGLECTQQTLRPLE